MFTGIIEEIGEVKSITTSGKSRRLGIKANKIFSDIVQGCSIAVNGICLTVISWNNNIFYADVMPETMKSSALQNISIGTLVNLERAMPANGRFDGHMVAGHIDGIAKLKTKKEEDNSVVFTFLASDNLLDYIVYKGSVAVNGISLTVSNVTTNTFDVSLIPHSLKETTMQYLKVGDIINVETDIVGRYIEKFMMRKEKQEKTKITKEFLLSNGFM